MHARRVAPSRIPRIPTEQPGSPGKVLRDRPVLAQSGLFAVLRPLRPARPIAVSLETVTRPGGTLASFDFQADDNNA